MSETLRILLFALLCFGLVFFLERRRRAREKQAAAAARPAPEPGLSREQTLPLLEELRLRTAREAVRVHTRRDVAPGLLDSKIGGVPYWDPDRPYPRDRAGQPLALLAQFDMTALPETEDLPRTGLLQFFLRPDDTYGLVFDGQDEPDGYQVVYHPAPREDVTPEAVLALGVPTSLDPELSFPVRGVFGVAFTRETVHMTDYDVRFRPLFGEIAVKRGLSVPASFDPADVLTEEELRLFHEPAFGHLLLGYPFFTQWDPREADTPYDTLLLQLDSDYTGGDRDRELLWGDSGVGAFFINRGDLRARQFQRTLFSWDCY